MGSAACYELAARGYHVLGLEQFNIPHEQGSHTGQSRIIRKAYFEHPGYVPLLERAYHNWKQLERQTGEQVYYQTGIQYYGPFDHPMITGIEQAAETHSLKIEHEAMMLSFGTDMDELTGKDPLFKVPFQGIYEPEAGFLQPGKAISLYKDEAIKKGADIHTNEPVLEWKKENGQIIVTSDKAVYHTKKLVITAGAWADKMIPGMKDRLKVTRQLIVWVKPENEKDFLPENFPCWLIADNKRKGALYGFPYLTKEKFGEPEGMKFAWHHPAEETDPGNVNRTISGEEINELVGWVAEYIPAVRTATLSKAKTCLYTNTEDENFIIDHLPGFDNDVTIACGFSGHGFKFVSVVGEILADLAMKGKTNLPVEFLSLKRFINGF